MKFASKLKVQLPLALGLSLISHYSMKLPANGADQLSTAPNNVTNVPASSSVDNAKTVSISTMAIRNIYLNENKQLVIEFDNPTHLSPAEPQIRDYPGQKHDIVLEFPQTSFAIDKAPKAKTVLEALMKVYPDFNSLSYATASDGTKSRIRLGVSPRVSAHPSLAKIDQESAVIDLAFSESDKTTAASAAVNDKPTLAETTKATAKAISATDTSPPAEGIKTKTVNGFKGAWTSSLKAGQNLGKIASINPFAHNKTPNQQSTPANTDIKSAANDKAVAPVSEEKTGETAAAVQTAPNATKLAASGDKATTVNPPATTPATADLASSTIPAAATTEMSPTKTVLDTTGTNPVSVPVSATSNSTEVANLKPEIIGTEIASPNKDGQLASLAGGKTTDASVQSQLPKIGASLDQNKTGDDAVITPLSVEQVLKEKASLEAAAASAKQPISSTNKTPNQPLSIESKDNNALATEFKTGLTKPLPESTDQKNDAAKSSVEGSEKDKKDVATKLNSEDQKEEKETLASVPPNPLDSLTSAAITNAGHEQSPEGDAAMSAAVKLKSQRAHAGGKDYFPPKFDDEAVDHYNAAVRFHLDGKLTEAITEYKAAIDADEKIAEAYSNLGLIYNQLHKYDLAMVEFHKALAINPKDAITFNGIGAAMRAKSNLLAAIKNWQTAIALDPNLASAHYNLGTAYEINKDLDKALAQYKEAVKHDDKLGEAYYRMGLILQKMNNKHLALEEYKQAIKISQQASYASDAKRRINLLSQIKSSSM